MLAEGPTCAADVSPVPMPEGMVEVGHFATAGEAADYGLVVLAMGLSYWAVEADGGHHVFVTTGEAAAVRAQLDLFARERVGWPPRPRPVAPLRFRWAVPGLWSLAVAGVFRLQTLFPGFLEAHGSLDAAAIFEHGQVWRVATALFLHADAGHLVANLGFGFLVFGVVFGQWSGWRGLGATAAAAMLGNLAAALLHPRHGYTAIGASTAVFAALGLLTGSALREADPRGKPGRLRGLFLPALAGVSLLALYGAGGLQTDVVAHGTGFLAGVAAGLLVSRDRCACRATAIDGCGVRFRE